MGGGQSEPAYSDVQQIGYSSSYVYINGAGLASHQMGPWYLHMGVVFGNWPSNQNYIRRFPRHPQVATTKTTNGGGPLGLWVNGVALFNLLDGASYSTSRGMDVGGGGGQGGQGDGIWVRNAVIVEAPSFDASNAHQPPTGEYHYHENPLALRYQLGDHVVYNAASNVYSEDTTALHHSPILGWAYDGYPIYGPYGYSNPTDPTSGVRRMVSGFILRDGSQGTTNLNVTGRTTLASWSASLHSLPQQLPSTQYGPAVSLQYTLGRYCEDWDYLGNLGQTQGQTFDLDVYNGRYCVTPEFPQGTYAYFTSLNANGTGAFPYVIGRQWYGVPSGSQVQQLPETITIYKAAGPNSTIQVQATTNAQGKQLQWTSVENGHYQLNGSNDGQTWTQITADVPSQGLTTTYSLAVGSFGVAYTHYQVVLTSLDPYDAAGVTGGSGLGIASPIGNSGTTTANTVAPGHTQLLWNNSNGQASLWQIASDGTYSNRQYGPFAGWTARVVSDGPDGTVHLLWTNANGQASVWNVAAGGSYTSYQYGPISGWQAVSLATGGNGSSHLLWDKTDGTASLWTVSTTTGAYSYGVYGPFSGWTANAVASGATVTDLLWNKTDGTACGYRIASDGSLALQTFGPFAGFAARALSVGSDDGAHLLWDKTDGTTSLWNVDFATGGYTHAEYGLFSGWSAMAIASASDGAHLLWDNTNGTVSAWTIPASGPYTHHEYGPFAGWSAVALSAGP